MTHTEWTGMVMAMEPSRIVVCGVCGNRIPDCLRYDGIYITEYLFGTSGDDLIACDACAREVYGLLVELESVGIEQQSEMKRWLGLRTRRINAALKRCGSTERIRRRGRRRAG